MKELSELLTQVLTDTTFRTSRGAEYSADGLRDALAISDKRVPDSWDVVSARAEVDDDWVSRLTDHLRHRLSKFIECETDRIGHSFRVVGDSVTIVQVTPNQTEVIRSSSTLPGFARGLVRAAAAMGPDRAARVVDLWADGEPHHYKLWVVLADLYVDQDIEPDQGLRICRLPVSSDYLPVSMPDMDWNRVGRILGHAALVLDVSTQPAVFAPSHGGGEHPALQSLTALGEVRFDTFLLALSLVCNRQIEMAWRWNDYGEAGSFSDGQRSSLGGPGKALNLLGAGMSYEPSSGVTELTSFKAPTANLSKAGLQRAWAMGEELQQRMDSEERFGIAVTRWAKAASPGVWSPDRVIDLRIALEALYLDSEQGELGFRLSVTGARHLADSLDDRKALQKTLKRFYGLASRVIHGTSTVRKGDLALVDKASRLCRDGILKIVEKRHQPQWIDVLLE